MTSVRRWAIENRTNGMLSRAESARPVRAGRILFSGKDGKTASLPAKSAPDALCQIMRNVKRTAGRRMRLQEGY